MLIDHFSYKGADQNTAKYCYPTKNHLEMPVKKITAWNCSPKQLQQLLLGEDLIEMLFRKEQHKNAGQS